LLEPFGFSVLHEVSSGAPTHPIWLCRGERRRTVLGKKTNRRCGSGMTAGPAPKRRNMGQVHEHGPLHFRYTNAPAAHKLHNGRKRAEGVQKRKSATAKKTARGAPKGTRRKTLSQGNHSMAPANWLHRGAKATFPLGSFQTSACHWSCHSVRVPAFAPAWPPSLWTNPFGPGPFGNPRGNPVALRQDRAFFAPANGPCQAETANPLLLNI
jgi:hypothetical protein